MIGSMLRRLPRAPEKRSSRDDVGRVFSRGHARLRSALSADGAEQPHVGQICSSVAWLRAASRRLYVLYPQSRA